MTKTHHRAARALLISAFCFVMPGLIRQLHAEESDDLPSWRRGISTWNGTGYTLPENVSLPGPTALDVPAQKGAVVTGTPYTVPTDPFNSSKSNPYLAPPGTIGDDAPLRLNLNPPASQKSPASSSTAETKPKKPFVALDAPPVSDDGGAAKSAAADSGTTSKQTKDAAAKKKLKATSSETTSPTAKSIEDKLNGPPAVEQAPLQADVVRWYDPRRWMRGWDSHAEFGLDGSNGNADTLALQTGLELKRKTDVSTLGIDVDYRQVSSRDTTTEDNGRFNVDYDRLVGDSPWAGFGKFGLEWDKFKAFDLRLNVNGGVAYHWIRRDDATFVTRFGAGASQEIGAPDDDWIAEAVFGIEADRQITARQKLKGKVDYFPAWEDFTNYRIVTDLAWEILLDGSENLSLKLAATDRYDSTPQGFKPNDIYYSLLLLYKF